ncbi:MAG: hypothetical protein H0U74_01085 [Bradymonadaceae bacterium]|nr:hypothetical protein [Lujinxingiaceae bacterium]
MNDARNYRLSAAIARLVVSAALLTLLVGALGACASSSESERAERSSEGVHDAELLYLAALSVYEERALAVDIASDKLLLVSSRYEALSPALRRRYVTRVLATRAGIALNVNAEYQRASELDGELQWALIDERDPLKAQAKAEELAIGRAVERAFHRRRGR